MTLYCKAKTKKGNDCKNTALDNGYCSVHQNNSNNGKGLNFHILFYVALFFGLLVLVFNGAGDRYELANYILPKLSVSACEDFSTYSYKRPNLRLYDDGTPVGGEFEVTVTTTMDSYFFVQNCNKSDKDESKVGLMCRNYRNCVGELSPYLADANIEKMRRLERKIDEKELYDLNNESFWDQYQGKTNSILNTLKSEFLALDKKYEPERLSYFDVLRIINKQPHASIERSEMYSFCKEIIRSKEEKSIPIFFYSLPVSSYEEATRKVKNLSNVNQCMCTVLDLTGNKNRFVPAGKCIGERWIQ